MPRKYFATIQPCYVSLTLSVLYRFVTSIFKTAEPLLRGQSVGGGVESAIKTIAYHSLSPSFSAMKTQKLAPHPLRVRHSSAAHSTHSDRLSAAACGSIRAAHTVPATSDSHTCFYIEKKGKGAE